MGFKISKRLIACSACFIVAFVYLSIKFKNNMMIGKYVEKRGEDFINVQGQLFSKQDGTKERRRLPQVIGIGVKKCGTGALKSFLNHHPSVKLPTVEPHFFDNNSAYNKGRELYRSLMPVTYENQTTMEITPKYYVTEWVPGRIREFYGENSKKLKFIVILCNPIDRIYSEYVHTKTASLIPSQRYYLEEQIGKYKTVSNLTKSILRSVKMELKEVGDITEPRQNSAFEKFIRDKYEVSFLTNGLYAFHMQRWLRYFSPEQILAVNGETLMKEPWAVMEQVQSFLGIDKVITKDDYTFDKNKGFYCIGRCLGRGKGRTRSLNDEKKAPHPPLTSEIRKALQDFYLPFNKRLFNLLNTTLEW